LALIPFALNAKGELKISRKQSRVACYVIPTDEELMIAEHALDAVRAHATAGAEEKRA
jgi:acetate kinase